MKIRANKGEVLKTVIHNRNQHAEIYAEAMAGYHEKIKEMLKEKLKLLEEGKTVSLRDLSSISRPVSHIGEYNTAVCMLNMHQDDIIELDDLQVQRFIQDHWPWKSRWLNDAQFYSSKAGELADQISDDFPDNF